MPEKCRLEAKRKGASREHEPLAEARSPTGLLLFLREVQRDS